MRPNISTYLGQIVNFGGQAMTRGEVYLWHQKHGYNLRAAEMWLMGYDQRMRQR